MTRSITLTNTSNWDGENYHIEGLPYHPEGVTLKPGESVTFTPHHIDDEQPRITFEAQSPLQGTRPFYVPALDGGKTGRPRRLDKQVMPRVHVEWES